MVITESEPIAPPSSDGRLALARAEWADRFVLHMHQLEAGDTAASLGELALQLWPRHGHLSPETAARYEYEEWPPPDTLAGQLPRAVTRRKAGRLALRERLQGFGSALPSRLNGGQ